MWCTTRTSTCTSSATRSRLTRTGTCSATSKPAPTQISDPGRHVLGGDEPGSEGPHHVVGRHRHLGRPRRRHREHRPQQLLPLHDVDERGPQRGHVERPRQPQRHRHVVRGGRRLELVDEPHPLLCPRQRNPFGPYARAQRPPVVGRGTARAGGEPAGGAAFEQVPHAEPQPRDAVDPRDRPGRAERVAAEREEVVVDTDSLDAGDLGEDRRPRVSSVGVLGARNRVAADVKSGSGRAARSSLPTGSAGSRRGPQPRSAADVAGSRCGREVGQRRHVDVIRPYRAPHT